MNSHTLLNRLKQRSHFIRGQRMVIDKDVAAVYSVSAGQLRRTVKRHIARFPPDFLLIENDQYFFTESGILMVACLLKKPQAVQISLDIVRELFSFPSN